MPQAEQPENQQPAESPDAVPANACKTSSILFLSTYFFCFYAILGSYLPFMGLFFQNERGFSGIQIGRIFSIRQLMIALAPPVWGMISDRVQRPRTLLAIGLAGSLVTLLLFDHVMLYWQTVVLMFVFASFNAPLFPLADSITLAYTHDCRGDFGRIRSLGSLGFVVVNLALFFLIRHTGRIGPVFYAGSAFSLLALVLVPSLPDVRVARRGLVVKRAIKLFTSTNMLVFTICAIAGNASMMAYYAFFPNYLDSLGFRREWLGLISAIGALSEIPFIFFAAVLVRKLGIKPVLAAGLCGIALRLFVLSLAPAPAIILLSQTLHSLTFGALMIGGIIHINNVAPKDLRASAQSVYIALTLGAGGLIGGQISGALYDMLGVFHMMLANAGISAAALILFLIAFRTKNTPQGA